MKFAQYYNVTNMLNKLIKEGKVFCYKEDYCKGLFICSDTHDFWICRIIEGYDSEYEKVEDAWLIERNKIDKYDFVNFIEEKYESDLYVKNRINRDSVIGSLTVDFIVENLILMDDDAGLENWDNLECSDYDLAIEHINGGYGIIELENVC